MTTQDSVKMRLLGLYQKYVLSTNTWDTGALYKSIEVSISKSGASVSVAGIHYLEYLDDGTRYINPRYITEQWFRDPEWDLIMEDLALMQAEEWVDKSLSLTTNKFKNK